MWLDVEHGGEDADREILGLEHLLGYKTYLFRRQFLVLFFPFAFLIHYIYRTSRAVISNEGGGLHASQGCAR